MKSILFSILCIFLWQAAPARADDYSAENLLRFTRFLIGKQEYYRALVELRRLQSYHPEFVSPAAGHVTGLYLLSMGKQYRDIIGATAPSGEPLIRAAGLVFACDAAIALSDDKKLESLTESWQQGADPFFDRCLRKRRLFSFLAAGRYDAAVGLCEPAVSPDYSTCRELIALAKEGLRGGKKPWLAGVLGVVPGAGYLYSGEIATGLFAFLLIAVDAVLTYFAFRTNNEVIGYFSGVVGGLFYAGSIAGGYFASRRYNIHHFETTRSSLAGAMGLDRDREEIFTRYGIGADGKP